MNQAEIERLLAPFPDMLTVAEVANLLRVHPRSVQRWVSQGHFTAVRAGRTYRIPRVDVQRWMTMASTQNRDASPAADQPGEPERV
jgi:excisionase family DNA binding protein